MMCPVLSARALALLPILALIVSTSSAPAAQRSLVVREDAPGHASGPPSNDSCFGAIPIFSVVLAPIFLREEKFSAAQIAGAGVGFAGVVLVIGPQALTGVGDQLLGTLITLLAALSYTLGAIYSRTRRDLSPVVMTAGQLITASAVLVPVSLIVDAPWTLSPSPAALGAVAWTAVIGTAAPVLLLFWLIRNAGAVSASLMTFFMPVVAVALGAAALGEALPWQAFAGLGLILLGAAAVSGRLKFGRSRAAARA